MWMPELIEHAGGVALGPTPGEHAPTVTRDLLLGLIPEVVLINPCGFPLERTLDELSLLRTALPWDVWPATLNGRVYVVDGNAYFNRPGPRIVESLEILAACVHPKAFEDFREKHAASVARIDDTVRRQHI
jgi:iron complex transport system substrate-binding protein